jgi:hypothetical protein
VPQSTAEPLLLAEEGTAEHGQRAGSHLPLGRARHRRVLAGLLRGSLCLLSLGQLCFYPSFYFCLADFFRCLRKHLRQKLCLEGPAGI